MYTVSLAMKAYPPILLSLWAGKHVILIHIIITSCSVAPKSLIAIYWLPRLPKMTGRWPFVGINLNIRTWRRLSACLVILEGEKEGAVTRTSQILILLRRNQRTLDSVNPLLFSAKFVMLSHKTFPIGLKECQFWSIGPKMAALPCNLTVLHSANSANCVQNHLGPRKDNWAPAEILT